jgi:putative two-component system response regulator
LCPVLYAGRENWVTIWAVALKIAKDQQPDLILLDIMMPEMDGYEVCERLKENVDTCNIPVIFLTAKSENEDEGRGFQLGAVDYIVKPISPPILYARVQSQLNLRQYSRSLEQMVAQRTYQLEQIQDATILAMGALAEYRDPETGNHIRRTQEYVWLLSQKLQQNPHFSDQLSPELIEILRKTAPLHDIGKVAIPDNILQKPAKLSDEEYEVMKQHTAAGRDVIVEAESVLEEEHQFLVIAREITYLHHEKWDGSGYPLGLAGEKIPLSARIMAVADVYDALVSYRVYKPAFTQERSVSIIEEGRGSHFDPDIVDVFLEIKDQFHQISKQYSDEPEPTSAKSTR